MSVDPGKTTIRTLLEMIFLNRCVYYGVSFVMYLCYAIICVSILKSCLPENPLGGIIAILVGIGSVALHLFMCHILHKNGLLCNSLLCHKNFREVKKAVRQFN